MNIAGVVLIFAGLILLALLPKLRPAKPPLRLGLTSKPHSDGELARQEPHEPEKRSQAA
ncbi:MAG TPA: hypothetical protein VN442_10370 [Bryobacteraceae bacterium]|nr:hypothetical protein [Bryobacteraceae bacterium]